MRLIDADALIQNAESLLYKGSRMSEFVKNMANREPTIDAEPVIRCKDCEHYDFTDNRVPQERVWWCYYWGCEIGANDFCSYAERKYNG